MSKGIFDDEPFRDGQPEFTAGKWNQQETYTPVAEDTIREARAIQKKQYKQAEEMLDVEEMDIENLTEEVSNSDEDEDFTEVLSDARLRLEQGKLYEMIMNHDLFGGVEADPRAAKSVQKQIRKFAKEQMEIMLGMRQEAIANNVVSSPFGALEVRALKDIAAKLISSKQMKEEDYPEESVETGPQPTLKRKTLNTISTNSQRTKPVVQSKPVQKKVEPIKRQAKPKTEYPPELEMDYKPLDKPIHEMTSAELAERDRQASERQKNRLVVTPKSQRAPYPSYEEQVSMAQAQVSRATNSTGGNNLSALIVANLKNAGKI